MRRVTLLLDLEARAKELQERAKGHFVETDDNGEISIAEAIESWLGHTKRAIHERPRHFKWYVKDYEELLVGFHNVLEYIEHLDNYKLGYAYRMIENELIKINYISENELVIRVG